MLILIPSALAIYGGESWNKSFDRCDKLKVNITGNLIIHDGEYIIHNECEETYENYFICNCTDNFKFNISFKTNAVNNYNFTFINEYSDEVIEETVTTSSSGSSGGSGGSSTHWNCDKWGSCINGNSTRYCYSFGAKRTEIINCTIEKKAAAPVIEDIIIEEEVIQEDITTVKENITEVALQPVKEPALPIFIIILLIIIIIFCIFAYYIYNNW